MSCVTSFFFCSYMTTMLPERPHTIYNYERNDNLVLQSHIHTHNMYAPPIITLAYTKYCRYLYTYPLLFYVTMMVTNNNKRKEINFPTEFIFGFKRIMLCWYKICTVTFFFFLFFCIYSYTHSNTGMCMHVCTGNMKSSNDEKNFVIELKCNKSSTTYPTHVQ